MLKGPTALAWARDPVSVAKVAIEFAKTNEKLVIIGGALGTQDAECGWGEGALRNCRRSIRCARACWGCLATSELPSLDTLRAGLLGMLATPATRIAGVLQAPGRPARAGFSGLRQEGRGARSLNSNRGAAPRAALQATHQIHS